MPESFPTSPLTQRRPPSWYQPVFFDSNTPHNPLYLKQQRRPTGSAVIDITGVDKYLYHLNHLPDLVYPSHRSVLKVGDLHEEKLDPKTLAPIEEAIHMMPRIQIDEYVLRLTKMDDILHTIANVLNKADLRMSPSGMELSDPKSQKELWALSYSDKQMNTSIPIVQGDLFDPLKLGEIAHLEESPESRKFIVAPMYDSTLDLSGAFYPYHVTATYMLSYSRSLLVPEEFNRIAKTYVSRDTYSGKDLHCKIDPFIEISFGE